MGNWEGSGSNAGQMKRCSGQVGKRKGCENGAAAQREAQCMSIDGFANEPTPHEDAHTVDRAIQVGDAASFSNMELGASGAGWEVILAVLSCCQSHCSG